jgi:bifunctional DNase/RNase
MVEVAIETLLVAMPPAPSVVVLRPANSDNANPADPDVVNEADEASEAAVTDIANTTPEIITPIAPLGSKDVLPIWIGPSEAASIGVALEHHPQPRPMTHDLLANTIYALGAKLERVVIDRVEGSTFYATVYVNRDGRILNIDARPSDSIALAVRMKAPLFVDEDVMNAASHKFSRSTGDTDVPDVLDNPDEAMDEFRDFLDSITPEDFTVSE